MSSRDSSASALELEQLERAYRSGRYREVERALSSPAIEVRDRAAEIAADVLAPARLVALLEEPSFAQRDAAMLALTLAGPPALPALAEAIVLGRPSLVFCIKVLGALGHSRAAHLLRGLVHSDDAAVSSAALEALGGHQDAESVPLLLTALQQDPWRAFAAIDALAKRADPFCAQALATLIDHELLGEAARGALTRLCTAENRS